MVLSDTLVFCLVLAIVQSRVDWNVEEDHWNKCVQETGAEESMEDVIKKEGIPTSDKGMCQIECLLRESTIYDADGKFNKEGAKQYLAVLFEEKPEHFEKALASVEECSKIDMEGFNKCEAAVQHVRCARDKFTQEHIEPVRD